MFTAFNDKNDFSYAFEKSVTRFPPPTKVTFMLQQTWASAF